MEILERIKEGYDFFRSNDGDLRKMIDDSKPSFPNIYGSHQSDSYREVQKNTSFMIGEELRCLKSVCSRIKGIEMYGRNMYLQNWMRVAIGSREHLEYDNWRKYVDDYRNNNSEDKWGIDYKIGDEVLTNLEEGFSGGTIVEISDNIMKISLNPIDRRRKKKEILTRIVEPRVFPDKPFSDI